MAVATKINIKGPGPVTEAQAFKQEIRTLIDRYFEGGIRQFKNKYETTKLERIDYVFMQLLPAMSLDSPLKIRIVSNAAKKALVELESGINTYQEDIQNHGNDKWLVNSYTGIIERYENIGNTISAKFLKNTKEGREFIQMHQPAYNDE